MPAFLRNLFRHPNAAVIILIAFNLIVGLLTFRDYGLTLDEPLYYQYADSLGYAYSPHEWFSGSFDLENAFGPSASDHQNRGPAYLLLARGPAHLLESLGLEYGAAWHLVNFVFFQIGIFFFFIFCRRWMKDWAAFATTLFFATQPLLWGHAFINPKDPPFLAAFLISLELGFRLADRIANPIPNEPAFKTFQALIPPAIVLGLATNLRLLGPLAGLLAFLYFLLLRKPQRFYWFIPYGIIALIALYFTWPYLWQAPVRNLVGALLFYQDNPTELRVLFMGDIYQADQLPLRYLPTLLLINLTELVWPLAIIGFIIAIRRKRSNTLEWRTLLPTLLWFVIPVLYVLIRRPAMYDGFRHSLFILPPIFILAGIALDWIIIRITRVQIRTVLTCLLILPAVIGNLQLHPYQYAYFNRFVGGTGAAASSFDTDYWSTCYKESIEQFNNQVDSAYAVLYVGAKGAGLSAYYAVDSIDVRTYRVRHTKVYAGEYKLESSRANPALQLYRDINEDVIKIQRDGAIFCVIRKSQ